MKTLEVTVSELTSGASNIRSANEALRDTAAQMKQAADELAAMWEGPTKERFVSVQADINQWYQQISSVVEEYAKSMETAANEYENTDKAAANAIRKH